VIKTRQQKKIDEKKKFIAELEIKMSAPDYATKSPPEVRAKNDEKLGDYKTELTGLEKAMADIQSALTN